jgi:hypothetical protein
MCFLVSCGGDSWKGSPPVSKQDLPRRHNCECDDQRRSRENAGKRLQSPQLQTRFPAAFRAGNVAILIRLPENTLKAIA